MRSRVVVAVSLVAGLAAAGDRGARTSGPDRDEMDAEVFASDDWARLLATAPQMLEMPAQPLAPRTPASPEEQRLVRDAPEQWHAAILDATPMLESEAPIDLSQGTVFLEMPWHLIPAPSALDESTAPSPGGRSSRRTVSRIAEQRDQRLERWQATIAELFGEERSCVSNAEECAASAFLYCEKTASKVKLLAFVDDENASNPGCWTKCWNGKQGAVRICVPSGVGAGGQCGCSALPCKWGSEACCPGVPPPWCGPPDES